MAITQLSVFLMNQPGALVDAIKSISDAKINIRALSIAEANDFGILRIIVSESDAVCKLLGDQYLFSRTEVVAAKMGDRSGALYPILVVLNEANINIEYMYAFTGSGPEEAYVVFRVNDVKTAEEVLNAGGIPTLSDESLKL